MTGFNTQKVWIIGASAGIGEALAVLMSNNGHEIYISARSKTDLDRVKASCAHPNKCHVIPMDVTDYKEIENALTKINGLDIMVFAAGIYTPGKLEDIDLQNYRNTIGINLLGAINVFSALKNRIYSGKPIHLAWIASSAGYRALPNANAYGISKAGLQYFSQVQRLELPKHVKVQMINPGFVKSRLTDKNKFNMPFLISSEKAAQLIYKGLQRDIFDIHFPKTFTYALKFLSFLPDWLYLRIFGTRYP